MLFRILKLASWLIRLYPFFSQKKYDLVIYKVDRLGDYIMARAYVEKLIKGAQGNTLLIVSANMEASARRDFPEAEVLALIFAGDGRRMVIRNTLTLFRIAALICAESIVSLRHEETELRDAVLTLLKHSNRFNFSVQYRVGTGIPAKVGRFPSNVEVSDTLKLTGLPEVLLRNNAIVSSFCARQRPAAALAEITIPTIAETGCEENGILLCPYGSVRNRDYPPLNWVAVIGELVKNTSLDRLYIMVDSKNIGRAEVEFASIGKLSPRIEVRIASEGDLCGMEAAISRARLVLSVETSVAHIATAMDRRAVIIIGGGHYNLFGPWQRSRRQCWVTNHLDCFNCDWDCIYEESICITKISTERVVAECLKVLAL